jgi:serine phosphatase RsbU (regulator of sigma subunit)
MGGASAGGQGFTARRHALSAEAATGVGAALTVLLIIGGVEVVDGPRVEATGWLAIAPFLAAAFAPWPPVAGIGVLATAAAAVVCALDESSSVRQDIAAVVGMAFAAMAAVAVSAFRQAQSQRYADLVKLANVAQEAVLRPLGPQVGQFAVAGRYVSASAAADIGGDLYEALDTPFGVRMIIGDVTGKGIDAVRTASVLLGAYRHVAFERSDLRDIVTDLDRTVSRSAGEEEFVTAALVEERGGTLTVLNCGHPGPLLLRQGRVIPLDPPRTAPPLGLSPRAEPRVEHLEPGDRLLLYTDGLAEARRAGEFFPTRDRAWALLGHGTVEHGLSSLESALVEWVPRGAFEDDIALLLLEYTGAAPEAEPAVPSWQIGGAPVSRS